MTTFAKHNDPTMGIYLAPSANILDDGKEIEWAFILADDELSDAYRTWYAAQDFKHEP